MKSNCIELDSQPSRGAGGVDVVCRVGSAVGLMAGLLGFISLAGCQSLPSSTGRQTVHELVQRSLSHANTIESRVASAPQATSKRTPEPTAKRFRQTFAPVIQVSHQSPVSHALVTDEFLETDIREAIQSLASQAEIAVVIDDSVSGAVTATIEDEPFHEALEKLLLPLGLFSRVHEGRYLVCDGDPESSMFGLIAERTEIQPLFTSPEELFELLPEKHKRYVRLAKGRNMLIVHAPPAVAASITGELQSFDRPVPQVVLEAMVVVVSPDSGFRFGADVGQALPLGEGEQHSLGLSGLALSGSWSQAAFSQLFGKFSVTSFFLQSLEQEGYVSIRATPHVMAKSGEKAEISIARETFFSTQPLNSQLLFRQDIQKVEAGITLEITPTIRGDNVLMAIDRAEVSEDIRSALNDPGLADPYPLINRRKVSTTVNVKDGETVVIGGLMQNQMVDRSSRVPILGDLPIIGKVFNKIEHQQEAAEVVVFISPRVVCDSGANGVERDLHFHEPAPVAEAAEEMAPVITAPDSQVGAPSISHIRAAAAQPTSARSGAKADPHERFTARQQTSAASPFHRQARSTTHDLEEAAVDAVDIPPPVQRNRVRFLSGRR